MGARGKRKRPSKPKQIVVGPERSGRRREVLIVVFLTALAFALGVYRLTAQSLWYDEGVSVWVSGMPLAKMLRWTAHDIQPPLYYLLLSGWMRLGGHLTADRTAFWLRFFSLMWAVPTVPLLYRVVRRLLGRGVAFAAALFVAISPMEVYYAQEGRMYTMLTFLVLLLADRMLVILHDPLTLRQRQKSWLLLSVLMAAAMYTHYFAAFFIVAVWLYFAIVWWKTGRKIVYLIEGLLSIFIAIFLYSPWAPYLTERFRVDTSYWTGTLKLHEALRHMLIRLSLGETVLEPVGIRLMWGYIVLWILGLGLFLVLLLRRGKTPVVYPFWFFLLYQVVPLALILGLTYRMPKFNPRYAMPILPAYLAWLGYAVVAPSGMGTGRRKTPLLGGLLSLLGFGFVLLTMFFSLRGLYFDPAFTKPDFRGAAAYVRQHIAPDETVILCSGHMFPVWDVYAADLPQVRIPDREVIDARHPLGYSIAGTLNEALAGKSGVWIVLWQDDVVDPNGYLLDFMERYGTPAGGKDFWHVRVQHFRLSPNVHFDREPPIARRADVSFQGGLRFLGYTVRDGGREVELFWKAFRRLPDLKIAYWLVDESGTVWGRGKDRRPAAYGYPADRWNPGDVVFGRFLVPAEPGTPPGDYRLCLKAYAPSGVMPVLDESGAPQSDYACAVRLKIEHLVGGKVAVFHRLNAHIAPGISLLGYDASPPEEVAQGQEVPLTLLWKADTQPDVEYSVALSLGGRTTTFPPAAGYPTNRWKAGDVVRSRIPYRVPADAEAGTYALDLSLVDASGKPAGPAAHLFDLKTAPAERSFSPRTMAHPVAADFSSKLKLLGLAWSAESGGLSVTLEWQAEAPMEHEWVGFVHALDAGGRLVSQDDHPLLAGKRPTPGWLPGEVVEETYRLKSAGNAAVLEIGVYRRSVDGPVRLPAYAPDGARIGDSVRVPLS